MKLRLWSTRTVRLRRSRYPPKKSYVSPEVVGLQRRRHRVDREVAPREVVPQRRALDLGQRAGCAVELGARARDVETHLGAAAVDALHDRGLEALVRVARDAELAGQQARELDRVALHHQVEVEALLAQQHVAHRAADQVDALERRRPPPESPGSTC